MARFLTNPEERALLYEAANGACSICGKSLQPDWHADHVVPYSMTRRTNVFEMQAVCGPCNLKKGDRSMSDINLKAARIGQRGAITTIYDRARRGETHTAIVLPTRYGKSDVMRVSGAMLKEAEIVSRSVVLSPVEYLRSQFVDADKWDEAEERYNLPRMRTFEVTQAPRMPFPRENAEFVSMTMQMANHHINLLERWVENEINRYQAPPMLFVDEAHTGSEDNSWGLAVQRLTKAGALATLLTATPHRSDQRPIPGFESELVDVRDAWKTERTEDAVHLFEGRKQVYRLRAHHVTTFRDAWATEPPVLCKINRIGFEVVTEEGHKLSELPADRAQRVLSRELRKPAIVAKACAILVEQLKGRQKAAPETSAIVFVGNDQPEDEYSNQHAVAVQRAIHEIDPNLHVIIATSSRQNAAEDIAKFANGVGDVLVVKQMAGIGVDIDHLKVCLDLSNVRQLAAFIQRTTRIATIWDRRRLSDWDKDVIATATYIAPDDTKCVGLFHGFITDQGGETTETDWTFVGEGQFGTGEGGLVHNDVAKDLIIGESIIDSDQGTAPGKALNPLNQLHDKLPRLRHIYPDPPLFQALESLGLIAERPPETPVPEPPQTGEETVRDVSKEQSLIRERINKLHRTVAKHLIQRGADRQKVWVGVWTEHKKASGIHPGKSLQDIPDTETLLRLERSMKTTLEKITKGALL